MPFKPLKVEEGATTEQLLAQIEAKDRKFRLAQALFMVSTLVALIVVVAFQLQTLNGIKQGQEEYVKNSKDSQQKIERRLDCMTVFFSQKDRTNLTIQNIDQCTLERDGDIQRFFTNDADGGTTSNKNEQVEGAPTPKVPAP